MYQPCGAVPCCQGKLGDSQKYAFQPILYEVFCNLVHGSETDQKSVGTASEKRVDRICRQAARSTDLKLCCSARRESASAATASDVTANGAWLELTSPPPSSSVGEEAFSISDAALRQGLSDEFD